MRVSSSTLRGVFLLLALVVLLLTMNAVPSGAQSAPRTKQTARETALDARGVLLVDGLTLPKLVPSASHYTVLQVSNKHSFGEYGTDSIRADYLSFAKFAQSQGEADEILFAQLIVNGAENREVAVKLGVDRDFEHPVLLLFPKNAVEPIVYPSDRPYHQHDLVRFLSQHSSFYFHIPGTSKTFDVLAKEFLSSTASEERLTLLSQAESELKKVTKADDKEEMGYYLKTMQKIMTRGDAFIDTEIKRLTSILDSTKLTPAQRYKMRSQVSVLKQFQVSNEGSKRHVADKATATTAAAAVSDEF